MRLPVAPLWLILFAYAVVGMAGARSEPVWSGVIPKDTDPDIKSFNTPHSICVDRTIIVDGGGGRHQLLLFIPGTGGHGRGAKAFIMTAASLGYHAIELMYPDDVSASVCDNDYNPKAFEAFRLAIIEGGRSPRMTVSQADSIENRLEKLLVYLEAKRPDERWDQFLNGDQIAWEKIAVAGQSQGGGHAALIAMKHRVARALMFGAPKDYSRAFGSPAAWYSEASATPPAFFFGINHQQDRQACSFPAVLQNQAALHMDRFGPPADVDNQGPPYGHARILTTNYPGTPVDSQTAHGTAIADRNSAVFRPVWVYMLTETDTTAAVPKSQ
jgi:pimeloyl-ACP methyl ester carboxylesterase